MKTMLALLSCMFISQAQATGYFRSGDDLGDLGAAIASRAHVDKQAFAKGYVAGVADAITGTVSCPSPNISEYQIYYTVAKYMKDRPEAMNHSAATLVSDALANAYPCHQK